MRRYSFALVLVWVLGKVAAGAATLPLAEGFEAGAGEWKLGEGVALSHVAGLAREGAGLLRCGCVKPEVASQATLAGVVVKPQTGYVLRGWVRFDGGAQYTLGMLNPDGTFFVCRDMYGFGNRWEEIVVPFRTETQTRLTLYAGRRYGTGAVLYDLLTMVEDDSVRTGDVSPAPNPFPAVTAAEEKRGYLLSPQLWLRPLYPTFHPLRSDLARPLECRLAADEYEPLSVALTALRELPEVRVAAPEYLTGPEGQKLALRVGVVRTLTRWQTNSAPLKPGQRFERLPLLIYPNQAFAVKARETAQLWLTVHARAGQQPGLYTGALRITGEGVEASTVAVRATVLPVKLEAAEPVYGMYYRHMEVPKEYQTEDFFRRTLADLKAHGMNSFCLYAFLEKKGTDGKWTVDLKQGDAPLSLPRQMDELKRAGLLASHHPLMLLSMESACNGHLFTEDAVVRAAEVVRRERGWPEFVWYLVDEPGKSRYEMARELTGYVHRVPGVRTTTAGVPEELADCYDVWIQSTPSGSSASQVKGIAARGKEPWAYNCTWNGSQPANDRFFAGYHTWTTGLRGNWQWCYTEGQQGSSRLTDELKVPLPYYEEPWYVQYVLPTPEGNLPTLGWEGRREGIDDYRYLQTLEHEIAKAQESGSRARKQVAAEAQSFLDRTRLRVTAPLNFIPGTNSSNNYGFSMNPSLRPEHYEAIRQQCGDYLIKLQGR